MAGVSTARRHPEGEYARLLRRPRYRGFVLTVGLARVSYTMFNVAGVLLVFERTGSATITGLTAAAAVLPGALAGPLLGAWLDVSRRRRLLIIGDHLLSAFSLILLVALAGSAPDWTLPLVGVLSGITGPFSIGGFYAAMVEITGLDLLDAASRIEATSLNLAFVIGPALAGVLVGVAGAAATVEVQAAMMIVVAGLIALNPAFGAQPAERTPGVRDAVRTGMRVLFRTVELRAAVLGSALSSAGWSLMIVGFPLYCARILGAPAHTSGYLWAALGVGSIVGTFALGRKASLSRSAVSYGLLAVSALLWPLAHALALGVLFVLVSGVLEGPAFSASIALRQRHVPAAVRAQVTTTIAGSIQVAGSAATAIGGAIADPVVLINLFVGLNLVAAAVALVGARTAGRRAATT